MKNKFKLFACCLMTRGASRTSITDVQRGKIYFIPNALFDLLSENSDLTIASAKAKYENKFDEEIDEYFNYLVENELGFFCDNPNSFPPISLDWERPEIITNALIDIDENSNYDVRKFLSDIQQLGCKNIEIRIFGGYNIDGVTALCNEFEDSIFRFVSIIVKYHKTLCVQTIQLLMNRYPRIQNFVVFSSEFSHKEDKILFVTNNIDSSNCCGVVSPNYFTPTLELFSESQHFNSCLNRKISVDVNGNLKNCPSLRKSFGKVNKVTISDLIKTPEFQKKWNISKQQIDTCKVCEFRNVCTDCRAYVVDPDSLYSKPAKCTYDPYTSTWNN